MEGNHADYLGWTINGETGTQRVVDGGVVRKKSMPRRDGTGGRAIFASPGVSSNTLHLHVGLKVVGCEVGG